MNVGFVFLQKVYGIGDEINNLAQSLVDIGWKIGLNAVELINVVAYPLDIAKGAEQGIRVSTPVVTLEVTFKGNENRSTVRFDLCPVPQ
jgi:hypothetical protein